MDRDGHALLVVAVATQPHGDAVPLGEAADHEQAHPARGVGGDVPTVRELVVEGREVLGRHTEATVGDLDEEATFGRAGTTDGHAGGGRGVGQRVVDDLGDQVDEVGADRTEDVVVRGVADVDALVVLDLGHGRADGVGHRDRAGHATTGRGAGEHQQRVAVPAHTGGEVVEAEQALEPLRVLLVALEALDEAELLVDEGGAATREGLEHVADLHPQAGLVTGEGAGLGVEVVHGPGELAHLLAWCVTGIGTNSGSSLAVTHGGDGLGQAVVRDVEGTLAHGADRDEQGADQGEDEDQGEGRARATMAALRMASLRWSAARARRLVSRDVELGVQELGVAGVARLDHGAEAGDLGLVRGLLLRGCSRGGRSR